MELERWARLPGGFVGTFSLCIFLWGSEINNKNYDCFFNVFYYKLIKMINNFDHYDNFQNFTQTQQPQPTADNNNNKMKNLNSKSFKQYQASSNKRSISPLLTSHQQPGLQSTSNSNPKSGKKKLIGNSPYQKAMKQFETYGKAQRKKTSNYMDAESAGQQHNKFRIVTEPVDDRIMHLAQSNIFNSSLAIKNPKKLDTEVVQSSAQIRLNLRQQHSGSESRSRERIYTKASGDRRLGDGGIEESIEKSESRGKSREIVGQGSVKCKNCTKFLQQLEYLNAQIKKLIKTKQLWKTGQLTHQEAQQIYSRHTSPQKISQYDLKGIKVSPYSHNSLQNLNKNIQIDTRLHSSNNVYKFADGILNQIKNCFSDMVSEIEALTFIDYPKMLQMQIFKYEPSYNELIDTQENQLRDLFGQLRNSIEGKIIDYDTYDSESENNYVKLIFRNLKSRLGSSLRENLELRICKAIYEKSQEISEESQEYLRKVIQEVLEGYVDKPLGKEKQRKQRQKERDKGKLIKK